MAKKLGKKVTGEEYERRKKLNLPVTKELRYMKRCPQGEYEEIKVVDYSIIEAYMPSETYSLEVVLETGEKIRVFSMFFSEMQKPSFERDMEEQMASAGEE